MENLKKFEEFDWKFGLGKKKEPVTADFEDVPEKKPYVGEDNNTVRKIMKKIEMEFDITNLKWEDDIHHDEEGSWGGFVYYLDGDKLYSDGYSVYIGDGSEIRFDTNTDVADEFQSLLRNKKVEYRESERRKKVQQYRAKYNSSNENRRYKK